MKNFLIPFLLIIVLAGAGCNAYLKADKPNRESYLRCHALFDNGMYAEAAEGFRNFAEKHPDDELADDAQYFLAYTLAYYNNKERSYQEALKEFKRLLEKYPKSYWAKDARNWVYQLEEAASLKDAITSLKAENERLKKDINRLMKTDIEMEKKRKKIK